MARILCAWEMGMGFGHLSNLKPVIDAALNAGHEVFLAAKDLPNVYKVFREGTIGVFQAPYRFRPSRRSVRYNSYTQLVLQRFETREEHLPGKTKCTPGKGYRDVDKISRSSRNCRQRRLFDASGPVSRR